MSPWPAASLYSELQILHPRPPTGISNSEVSPCDDGRLLSRGIPDLKAGAAAFGRSKQRLPMPLVDIRTL